MSSHDAAHAEPIEQGRPVTFTVDGTSIEARYGEPLLPILQAHGYDIPTLCHHEAVSPYGACRLCIVEVRKGRRAKITTSCNYPCLPGIEVITSSPRLQKHRKVILELHLARCPESPDLKELAAKYGVTETRFVKGDKDCILCGLCERVCREVVGIDALSMQGRGVIKSVGAPFSEPSKTCFGCGACVYVCPVNCIGEKIQFTQREIVRWDRKLPMQTCSRCGYPFAPTFQLMQFRKMTGLPWEFFQLCPDCRGVSD